MPFSHRVRFQASHLLDFLRLSGKVAKRYKISRATVLWRAARLHFQKGFALEESLIAGLLSSETTKETFDACVSKLHLVRLQSRVNPRRYECMTEDKVMFYSFCTGFNLPVPKLYCVIDGPIGLTTDGGVFSERKTWEEYLEKQLPAEFVIKPAGGAYGHEVTMYTRTSNGFVDSSGTALQANDILDRCRTSKRYKKFLISERMHPHPDLARLSGTQYLQTARMVTFVEDDRNPALYIAYLKVISSDLPVDNFDHGATGNIASLIDVETSRMMAGFTIAPDRLGFMKLTQHPRTGAIFTQYKVPMWEEACSLVQRAALCFLPLRTIGWDVGITDKGPVLIEGNVRYDPWNRSHVTAPDGTPAKLRSIVLLKKLAKSKQWRIKNSAHGI